MAIATTPTTTPTPLPARDLALAGYVPGPPDAVTAEADCRHLGRVRCELCRAGGLAYAPWTRYRGGEYAGYKIFLACLECGHVAEG